MHGQVSELQRASIERKCCELKVELRSLWCKLQTELSRNSELGIYPGQRIVVDPSVENKSVAALKTQIAALWSQGKK